MDFEKSFLLYLVLIFYIFSLKKTKKFPFLLSLQLSPKTLFDELAAERLLHRLFIYLFLTILLFVVFAARPHTSTRTIVLTTTLPGMTKVRLTAPKSYR